jgi:hypothetical protein
MTRIQIGSALIKADAISSVITTNRRIDNETHPQTGMSIVELFDETSSGALELAIKDFENINIIDFIKRFYSLNDKAKFIALYLKALKRYKKGFAKDLIDSSSVRVWHYGSGYPLFNRIHNEDI